MNRENFLKSFGVLGKDWEPDQHLSREKLEIFQNLATRRALTKSKHINHEQEEKIQARLELRSTKKQEWLEKHNSDEKTYSKQVTTSEKIAVGLSSIDLMRFEKRFFPTSPAAMLCKILRFKAAKTPILPPNIKAITQHAFDKFRKVPESIAQSKTKENIMEHIIHIWNNGTNPDIGDINILAKASKYGGCDRIGESKQLDRIVVTVVDNVVVTTHYQTQKEIERREAIKRSRKSKRRKRARSRR